MGCCQAVGARVFPPQNVRRKLESLSASAGGMSSIARVCLPGRAMLPAGINDTIVPIYDSEPTSVIAHCLSTRAYQMMLNAAMKAIFQVSSAPCRCARCTQRCNSWNRTTRMTIGHSDLFGALPLLMSVDLPRHSARVHIQRQAVNALHAGRCVGPCGRPLPRGWMVRLPMGLMLRVAALYVDTGVAAMQACASPFKCMAAQPRLLPDPPQPCLVASAATRLDMVQQAMPSKVSMTCLLIVSHHAALPCSPNSWKTS